MRDAVGRFASFAAAAGVPAAAVAAIEAEHRRRAAELGTISPASKMER